jgi:hypothetical protein
VTFNTDSGCNPDTQGEALSERLMEG